METWLELAAAWIAANPTEFLLGALSVPLLLTAAALLRRERVEEVAPAEPEPSVEVAEAQLPPPPARLRDRLRRTHDALLGRLGSLLGGRVLDAELFEELETLLFGADLGVSTAEALLDRVRREASGKDADTVRAVLRDAILERLRRLKDAGLGDPEDPVAERTQIDDVTAAREVLDEVRALRRALPARS